MSNLSPYHFQPYLDEYDRRKSLFRKLFSSYSETAEIAAVRKSMYLCFHYEAHTYDMERMRSHLVTGANSSDYLTADICQQFLAEFEVQAPSPPNFMVSPYSRQQECPNHYNYHAEGNYYALKTTRIDSLLRVTTLLSADAEKAADQDVTKGTAYDQSALVNDFTAFDHNTMGVEGSVLQSLNRLWRRYPNPPLPKSLLLLEAYIKKIEDEQRKGHAQQVYQHITRGSFHYIGDKKDECRGWDLTRFANNKAEALALIWHAIHDNTVKPTDQSEVTDKLIALRCEALIDNLLDIFPHSESYNKICETGQLNKIVASLDRTHPDVRLYYGKAMLIPLIQQCVIQQVARLTPEERVLIHGSWDSERGAALDFVQRLKGALRIDILQELDEELGSQLYVSDLDRMLNCLFDYNPWDIGLCAEPSATPENQTTTPSL